MMIIKSYIYTGGCTFTQ